MLVSLLLFALGLALLIISANYLVDGASALARHFGISTIVIGLTIVAFGTSMPEFVVNMFASYNGNVDIAIGNIIGSNIANILFILGLSAVVFPLTVKEGTTWKEIPLALLAVVLVYVMANDAVIDGASASALTRIDGFVLLCFLVIFLYYVFSISKLNNGADVEIKMYSLPVSGLMIFGGLVGLTLGGKLIVDAAVDIASSLGVSEALIGLTIVAVGTSLPELATSVVAAYKKNPDIAVGNVVGSNILNVLWILGLSATIRPLPFSPALNFDVIVVVLTTLLLFAFMFIGKRHLLKRWQGVTFILLYVAYVTYLICRG